MGSGQQYVSAGRQRHGVVEWAVRVSDGSGRRVENRSHEPRGNTAPLAWPGQAGRRDLISWIEQSS